MNSVRSSSQVFDLTRGRGRIGEYLFILRAYRFRLPYSWSWVKGVKSIVFSLVAHLRGLREGRVINCVEDTSCFLCRDFTSREGRQGKKGSDGYRSLRVFEYSGDEQKQALWCPVL